MLRSARGAPGPWNRNAGSRVQQLHLVGFTTDRRALIFSVRRGAKTGSYTVAFDDELLAAVDDLRAWLAEAAAADEVPPLVVTDDRPQSQLSVREVQARLRRGMSIDEVADDAGVDPTWVARFASPVLTEQAEVIRAVRASRFAKRTGISGAPLGEAVYRNLAERGVLASREELDRAWAARQLADGLWEVSFHYLFRKRDQRVSWSYDDATGKLTAGDRLASVLAFRPGGPKPKAPAAKPSGAAASSRSSASTTLDEPPASAAKPKPAKASKKVASARKAAAARMAAEAQKASKRNAAVARQAARRPPRAVPPVPEPEPAAPANDQATSSVPPKPPMPPPSEPVEGAGDSPFERHALDAAFDVASRVAVDVDGDDAGFAAADPVEAEEAFDGRPAESAARRAGQRREPLRARMPPEPEPASARPVMRVRVEQPTIHAERARAEAAGTDGAARPEARPRRRQLRCSLSAGPYVPIAVDIDELTAVGRAAGLDAVGVADPAAVREHPPPARAAQGGRAPRRDGVHLSEPGSFDRSFGVRCQVFGRSSWAPAATSLAVRPRPPRSAGSRPTHGATSTSRCGLRWVPSRRCCGPPGGRPGSSRTTTPSSTGRPPTGLASAGTARAATCCSRAGAAGSCSARCSPPPRCNPPQGRSPTGAARVAGVSMAARRARSSRPASSTPGAAWRGCCSSRARSRSSTGSRSVTASTGATTAKRSARRAGDRPAREAPAPRPRACPCSHCSPRATLSSSSGTAGGTSPSATRGGCAATR